MNLRAAALGLADTHYANPIGLDQPGNYSSAADLVALGRRLLEIPRFARIAASRTALLRSLRPEERIYTRNTLLDRAAWANGVKTGHTIGARYVLVGSGRRGGVELISAVLGAPNESQRDAETLDLLDYGFSLYRRRRPLRAGSGWPVLRSATRGGELPLLAARTVAVGLRREQRLSVEVRAPSEVEGPIRRRARIGSAIVRVDGRRAARIPLLASRAIPRASDFDRARSFVSEHPATLAAAAFVILMGAVSLRWLVRRRRRSQ